METDRRKCGAPMANQGGLPWLSPGGRRTTIGLVTSHPSSVSIHLSDKLRYPLSIRGTFRLRCLADRWTAVLRRMTNFMTSHVGTQPPAAVAVLE